jgi:hypothetical protein
MVNVTASEPVGSPGLEAEVDEDITGFEVYFCQQVDPSAVRLTGPERAIIKTYLAYKLKVGPASDRTDV